jgi:hypothetical protein
MTLKETYPFVRVSHHCKWNEKKTDQEPEVSDSPSDSTARETKTEDLMKKNQEEKLDWLKSTAVPCAEVVTLAPKADWQYFFPSFDVLGMGITDDDDVVVFGNTFFPTSLFGDEFESIYEFTEESFPDGPCDKPFSVVATNVRGFPSGGIFIIPTAPFVTKNDKGDLLLKIPCVWTFDADGSPSWKPIPTPSFPNLDYASIFLDPLNQLHLVLVQRSTAAKARSTMTSSPPKDKNETTHDSETEAAAGRL